MGGAQEVRFLKCPSFFLIQAEVHSPEPPEAFEVVSSTAASEAAAASTAAIGTGQMEKDLSHKNSASGGPSLGRTPTPDQVTTSFLWSLAPRKGLIT